MTHAAQAAKAIRIELKKAFPSIKFSVTSSNFAGGNSVDIRYTDGVLREEVERVTRKYQYGHFDGMTDSYDHSNVREDIPQAKYVSVRREVSQPNLEAIKAEIMKNYGLDDFSNETVMKTFGYWPEQVIWREASKRTFA